MEDWIPTVTGTGRNWEIHIFRVIFFTKGGAGTRNTSTESGKLPTVPETLKFSPDLGASITYCQADSLLG